MTDKILIGIMSVFFIMLMALIPPFSQFKSMVNNGAFRQIKVKKLSFMFRAPQGISVSKEGVALPVFIIQVIGYVTALLCAITDIILFVLLESPLVIIVIVTIATLVTEVIAVIIFELVLCRISHSRKVRNNKKQSE